MRLSNNLLLPLLHILIARKGSSTRIMWENLNSWAAWNIPNWKILNCRFLRDPMGNLPSGITMMKASLTWTWSRGLTFLHGTNDGKSLLLTL